MYQDIPKTSSFNLDEVWSPPDTLGETSTINIPKTKPLHIGMVRWSSWVDEGHLRPRGNDYGAMSNQEEEQCRGEVMSPQEVRNNVSSGGKVMYPHEVRSNVSSGGEVMSPKEEQCLLR
ncbi:hypothetical protein Tco_1250503, partial [Tanacetum coccineum]